MGVNKVEYGSSTLVDLTGDTVTPETLLQGETAHNAAGNRITGTARPGVQTFNGRSGSVLPIAGDYSADQVNYDSNKTVKQVIDALATKETSDITGQQSLLKDTVGWTGKNLLKNTATSQTIYGVTFTVNSDGSVTANGTGIGNSSQLTLGDRSDGVKALRLKKGKYTINGSVSVGDIHVATSSNADGNYLEIPNAYSRNGNDATFEITDTYLKTGTDYCPVSVYLQIGANIANNLTFYPMLRHADITDPTYEPYHESVEDVVEQVYVDNGVLGAKNLLKYPYHHVSGIETPVGGSITYLGVTYTVNDDYSITANGTATGSSYFVFNRKQDWNDCDLYGKKIKIIVKPVVRNTFVQLYDTDNSKTLFRTDASSGAVEFTFPDSLKNNVSWNISLNVSNRNTVSNVIFKTMITLASDPDDTYQPYAMTNRELTEKVFEKRALSSGDDLNNITETGIYHVAVGVGNVPDSRANLLLIVDGFLNGQIRQTLTTKENIYTRSKEGTTWSSWYKFTGTVVS